LKGWLLDTNVVAALINPNGAPSVKEWARDQAEDSFFISILTLAEYDKGIHNLAPDHTDRPRYKAARDALAMRFKDRILGVGNPVVLAWGRLSGEIRRTSGHPPPVIDTMLAATAIEHELYLVTRNTKDVSATGAVVFDPWNDDPDRFPLASRLRKPVR
jgi:hypothetical protein